MPARKVAVLLITAITAVLGDTSSVKAAPLDIQIHPGQTEREQLRNAFLTVDAYVEKRRPVLKQLITEVGVDASPLDAAVTAIITLDRDALAPIRRRRLAIRLLAYARDEPDAVQAVKRLIGRRETALIMHRLGTLHTGSPTTHPQRPPMPDPPSVTSTLPPPPPPPPHTSTTLQTSDGSHGAGGGGGASEAAERDVSVAVAQVAGPLTAGSCRDWRAWAYVGASNSGNDVSISLVAQAGQTLDYARKNLDPQSWAGCSQLWITTYLTDVENGHVITDPSTNKPVRGAPQPKGDPYSGYLYENFVCDDTKSPFPCSLEVVLKVDTYVSALGDTYSVTYGQPIEVSGAQTIVVDGGWVQAKKNGASLDVSSEKTLGFVERDDARLLYLALKRIDVSYYMQELVCCP